MNIPETLATLSRDAEQRQTKLKQTRHKTKLGFFCLTLYITFVSYISVVYFIDA